MEKIPKCTKCNDTKYLEVEVPAYDINNEPYINPTTGKQLVEIEYAICECQEKVLERKFKELKYQKAGIPEDYWDYDFDVTMGYYKGLVPEIQKNNKEKIDYIIDIYSNPSKFAEDYKVLWIYNKTPISGKTSIIISLGKKYLNLYRVKYFTMANLIKQVSNIETKDAFFESMKKYKLFIIDDAFYYGRINIPDRTNYIVSNLYEFFSTALEEGKKFICASDTDPAEIKHNSFSTFQSLFIKSSLVVKLQGSFSENIQNKINDKYKLNK